jgi:cobalt-zinc-cadmium efflux system membrane fusion protein
MTPVYMNQRSRIQVTVLLVTVVAFGSFVLGLRLAPQARTERPAEAPRANAPAPSPRVRLPEGLRRHAGVRVEAVRSAALAPSLEVGGSVEFDPERVAEVGGRVGGRITRIHAAPGAIVRAGDPLVSLASPALGQLASSGLTARAQLVAARANLARLEALSAQRLVTGLELDEARARVGTLLAELRAVEAQQSALGLRGAERGSSAEVTLRAPIAGRVVLREARVGQVIDATDTLLRVADLTRVQVSLAVFERAVGRVRAGDRVELRAESHPDRTFDGRVLHVGSVIDPETRTASVRVAVDNADESLRPGQFVSATVRLSAPGRAALLLPRDAVVLIEGQPTVFVALAGDTEFEPRPIGLGGEDGARVEVTRGLQDGERVAVDGVFALKSELQR